VPKLYDVGDFIFFDGDVATVAYEGISQRGTQRRKLCAGWNLPGDIAVDTIGTRIECGYCFAKSSLVENTRPHVCAP
jgi:hypothetical protein